MKNSTITTVLYLILSFILSSASAADNPSLVPDLAKEKRWEDQIVPMLIVGDSIKLKTKNVEFLGLYAEATTDTTRGAVILLHGGGIHPDWEQVIKPLRTQLPDEGWSTLSIQLPVLANTATEEDYAPLFKQVPARIQASIEYLNKQNIRNIVLIGHSLGASMASDYLSKNNVQRIKAFVGIGMKGLPRNDYPMLDNVNAMLQIRQPILDIYGSETIKPILKSVDRRAFAMSQGNNQQSRQVKVIGADHFFEGHETQLTSEISSFMNTVASAGRNANK